MKILGIESSCDETACAVVEDGRKVLSNIVATSLEEHKLYGGVVPEIASRRMPNQSAALLKKRLKRLTALWMTLKRLRLLMRRGL